MTHRAPQRLLYHRHLWLHWMAVVVLFTVGGYWACQWRTAVTDQAVRAHLQHQAWALGMTINPERVLSFDFAAADLDNPAFQRLQQQLAAYCAIAGCRGIWTSARRGDRLLFGPESYAPGDPMASFPGAPYQQAPQAVFDIFRHGRSVVIGPYTDEFGTFLSAVAPIRHPRNNEVLMVVGMDMDAAAWTSKLANTRRLTLLATAGLGILALAAIGLLHGRSHWSPVWRERLRHTETMAVILFGVAATLLAAWLFHDSESRLRQNGLRQLAQTHFHLVQEAVHDLRTHHLEAVARLYQSSRFVDRDEFRVFTDPMVRRADIHAMAWLLTVPADQVSELGDYARGKEVDPFAIWQLADNGRRQLAAGRQTYHPVWYVEPWRDNQKALGFDFGSEPLRRAALETAAISGLPTATAPINLIAFDEKEEGIAIVLPVRAMATDLPAPLHNGFVLAVLRPLPFLENVLALSAFDRNPIALTLCHYSRDNGFAPLSTAGAPHNSDAALPAPMDIGGTTLSSLFPLFAFGRSYALVVNPTPVFLEAHPARAALITVLAGGLLTTLTTLLTLLLVRRRSDLEREVRNRTAELQAARETSARNERFLDSVLESVQDGISVLDTELNIIHANKMMAKWYPVDGALVGQKCHRVYHNSDTPCAACPTLRCIRSGRMEREIVPGRPDTPVEWIELYSYPIKAPDTGEVTGVVEFVRDITEQRRLQAQLFQSQKMESVGRLAGGVAHDFNNMLSVISGYSELLLDKLAPDDPSRQDVAEIASAAQRSALLVRHLLAFARKQTIAPVSLDLNTTVGGMIKMLERMIGEHIAIEWRPAPDLWRIRMDPAQLDQVLTNLAVNARDAIAGTGRVIIETANATFDEAYSREHAECLPGQYVMLAVSDNGQGMEKQVVAQLFEPFFTTKPQGEGTGLGLSTVYGIVTQNRGFVNVYSEPGTGSTFRIYLPRDTVVEQAPARPTAPAPAPSGTETVLLVEDEPSLLELATLMLQRLGYTVVAAQSPGRALALARAADRHIDLLMTDVIMPEMSGRDLWQAMRALRPTLKCLFMSGYTANVIAHHGVLEENVYFLQKPFNTAALAAKLREVLADA
ncbi:CHASE domain-containing protein [Desulfatitalea alkaliphila]|uniref:histidine kinase n=1 Tax=Desulfatitalea alkaliphila TaxID=2929485 RepID=A0AA41R6Y0_9BACT|nr:CHASE domain-containing protein [Desulfatitalea alkaliphila]MCJ8502836.1 CHASE domain-containing protein [Desulfatitalea alkaliphila]